MVPQFENKQEKILVKHSLKLRRLTPSLEQFFDMYDKFKLEMSKEFLEMDWVDEIDTLQHSIDWIIDVYLPSIGVPDHIIKGESFIETQLTPVFCDPVERLASELGL